METVEQLVKLFKVNNRDTSRKEMMDHSAIWLANKFPPNRKQGSFFQTY